MGDMDREDVKEAVRDGIIDAMKDAEVDELTGYLKQELYGIGVNSNFLSALTQFSVWVLVTAWAGVILLALILWRVW